MERNLPMIEQCNMQEKEIFRNATASYVSDLMKIGEDNNGYKVWNILKCQEGDIKKYRQAILSLDLDLAFVPDPTNDKN